MSTLILNSLEIRNFRAFRDLKIERYNTLNVGNHHKRFTHRANLTYPVGSDPLGSRGRRKGSTA